MHIHLSILSVRETEGKSVKTQATVLSVLFSLFCNCIWGVMFVFNKATNCKHLVEAF